MEWTPDRGVERQRSARGDVSFQRGADSAGRDWSRPFQQLCNTTRLQRTWGDSYGYAMVASGRAEIMIDARMKVWDCAAPAVIIEEAGGKFTDWKGESTIWGGESVGTNVALHQQAIDSLGKSE
ncbi:MAG: inositol monophosphatase family protein [Anaerolineae bacterium]